MTTRGSVLGRFDRPSAETTTRLAVLSDLHLNVEDEGTWRVSHRTEDRLESAVESLNRQDLDGVVFNGDLVQNGARAEYRAFDRIVDDLDAPFFAVPGNHDVHGFGSKEKLTLAEFERRYTPGGLPYHERIGGVDLLALDSNRSSRDSLVETYTGRLSTETLEWVEDKLSTVEAPIVSVHHNLPGSRAFLYDAEERFPVDAGSPNFENADELMALLVENEAPLVLTGHVHFPGVIDVEGVREFTLPALGPYPCGYTVLDVDERGTTAYFHPVADSGERIEALSSGLENCRVLLAASQLAGLPLVDDFSDSDCEPEPISRE